MANYFVPAPELDPKIVATSEMKEESKKKSPEIKTESEEHPDLHPIFESGGGYSL